MSESFKRGDIFWTDLCAEDNPNHVLTGRHLAVCVNDSDQPPYTTVVVLPMTSLINSEGRPKKRMPADYLLRAEDYPNGPITRDTIVRTHQIRCVSRERLVQKAGRLNDVDWQAVELLLIPALQLDNAVREILYQELKKILESAERKTNK